MVDRSFGTFDPKISINGDTRHSNGLMPPDGDRAEAQGDLASLRADIVMGPGNFGACTRVLKPLAAHAVFASKLMEVVDIRRKHMAPDLASPPMDCSVDVTSPLVFHFLSQTPRTNYTPRSQK